MKCSASYTLVVVSDGASVKGITAYYALSNTATAPSSDSFSTEMKTPSATERYLWCFEETTFSDDSAPKRTEPRIIGTYVTDGKDAPKVLIQYQYSASDRTPPTKLTLYKVNGYLVSFVDGVLGDDNGADWSTDPSTITSSDDAETWETDPTALVKDTSKPYLWMRVSTDGGKSWQYSVVTGPKASFFELLSSKDTFRQNARGAVDEADSITFWVVRHEIDESEKCTWSVSPDTLTIDADSVHADSITIAIPVGFAPVSFTVSLQVGQVSETLSKTINAMTVGSIVSRKLKTIDRSAIPYDDFPTTLDDGVSPVKDGDYLLVRLADENGYTYLVPYRYSESVDESTGLAVGWVPSSGSYANHSEIMGNCLQEVLANAQTTPSTSALYGFFQNLVSNDAFIRFLCTQYLEIQGAIYGGALDKDGQERDYTTTINGQQVSITSGFFLDYLGRFIANNATLNDVNIINKNADNKILLNTQYTETSDLVSGDTETATMVAFSDLSDTNLTGGDYALSKEMNFIFSKQTTEREGLVLQFTLPIGCMLFIDYNIKGKNTDITGSASFSVNVNSEQKFYSSDVDRIEGRYESYSLNAGDVVLLMGAGIFLKFKVYPFYYLDYNGKQRIGVYPMSDGTYSYWPNLYFYIYDVFNTYKLYFPYGQLGSFFLPSTATPIKSDGNTLDSLTYAISASETASYDAIKGDRAYRQYLLEDVSWISTPRTGKKYIDSMNISATNIYFLKGTTLVYTLPVSNRFEFHYYIKLLEIGDGIAISNIYRSSGFDNSSIGTASKPFEYAYIDNIYGTLMNFQQLLLLGVPTSEDGLAVGTVWNDNGTLKIKQ